MGEVSKGEGRTVLFVSHNMGSIKNLCNKGIMLSNGALKLQGEIEPVIEEYYRSAVKVANLRLFESGNNDQISIENIIVDSGIENNIIPFDSPIKLTIKGKVFRKFNSISFALNLISSDNVSVFTTRLTDNHIPISLNEQFSVSVTIPHSLRAGNYRVALGIDDSINNIYFNDEVLWIEISETGQIPYRPKNYGLLNIDSHWSVQ
jgi:lipopolysaccharide transport system ATP-binding protein